MLGLVVVHTAVGEELRHQASVGGKERQRYLPGAQGPPRFYVHIIGSLDRCYSHCQGSAPGCGVPRVNDVGTLESPGKGVRERSAGIFSSRG